SRRRRMSEPTKLSVALHNETASAQLMADQQREVGHQLRGSRLVVKRDGEFGGFAHSAASRCAAWSVGKSQITTVPLPTTESTCTLPPCSSTKERTSDSPSPAPRCRDPWERLSNQSN